MFTNNYVFISFISLALQQGHSLALASLCVFHSKALNMQIKNQVHWTHGTDQMNEWLKNKIHQKTKQDGKCSNTYSNTSNLKVVDNMTATVDNPVECTTFEISDNNRQQHNQQLSLQNTMLWPQNFHPKHERHVLKPENKAIFICRHCDKLRQSQSYGFIYLQSPTITTIFHRNPYYQQMSTKAGKINIYYITVMQLDQWTI